MGTTINEVFGGNPMNNLTGVVSGTVTCTAFPAETAKLLRLKANPQNDGNFLIGVVGTGECDWPMAPGDDTGWIAPPYSEGNLAGLHSYKYLNLSGSTEYMHYWVQR